MRGARLLSILVALGAITLGGGVASAADNVVRITSTLDPGKITIAPGQRVTWRNDDDERHRIRSLSGPAEFDSGNLEPGQEFRVTLTKPGRYEYYDHRNDELTRYYGTVVVKDGGGGDDPDGPSDPGDPSDPGAAAPTRATIAIGDRVFRPGNVTIAAGGSVTFQNNDDRDHTATGSSGSFDTGALSPGESARESFSQPGTFPFLCLIHPEMKGTVTVTGSGGGGGGGGAAPAPTPKPTPKPDEPASGTSVAAVAIRDFEFGPSELTIDAGTRVTFDNRGSAAHTVTAQDASFDSGLIAPGAAWDRTFATAGTFAFVCAFHPQMTGTIRVQDASGAGAGVGPDVAPTVAPTATAPPSSTAQPSAESESASGDPPTADPAAGSAATGSAGDAAGPSRAIGAVLIGVAAAGGMLLIVGAGIVAVRPERRRSASHREVHPAG